jgi:hypothetical protein
MTNYKWKDIIKQAQKCKKNVETEYRLGMNSKWSYYFAKAIMTVNTDVKKINFTETTKPIGNNISNQIYKKDYFDMCKRLIKYVETHKQMPNYITYKNYKVLPRLATYMFSRILVYYNKNGTFPKYANINSKCFTKPTETGNAVFDYWVKKFGFKPTCIDDVCDYIRDHFEYEFYFDDYKSNQQVIDSKAGNCVDLTQMAVNMAKALGYEWEVIHTECRQSGTGHVYPRFRKGGEWFTRDVACIADESTYCVWCDVEDGRGYLLAKNPSWLLENLNR